MSRSCRIDPFGIFCFLFFYGLLCYVDFVFIVYIISPILSSSLIGFGIILAGYQICLLMISWSHLMCVFSDAGIVQQQQQQQSVNSIQKPVTLSQNNCDQTLIYDQNPQGLFFLGFPDNHVLFLDGRHHQSYNPSRVYQTPFEDITNEHHPVPMNQMYEYLDWTYCKKCHVYRPPGAHHCQICRHCILRMDHHCPWINNCVGQYNQKYFIQFTSYAFIGCIYTIIGIIISWALLPPIDALRIVHITLITLVSVIFGLFAVAVFSDQMQNIFNDTSSSSSRSTPNDSSTIEQQKQRKKWVLQQVFGDISPILWAIPYPFKSNTIKVEKIDQQQPPQTTIVETNIPMNTCAV